MKTGWTIRSFGPAHRAVSKLFSEQILDMAVPDIPAGGDGFHAWVSTKRLRIYFLAAPTSTQLIYFDLAVAAEHHSAPTGCQGFRGGFFVRLRQSGTTAY